VTTIDLRKIRGPLEYPGPALARLRRGRYRLRRRAQLLAESIAERLRPMNIDSRDPGRLAAAMTASRAMLILLVIAATLLLVLLDGPVARDTLRALGLAI
jgi:hypothetical protein